MSFISNPFSKVNLKSTAVSKKAVFNLNCNHYTTFQFGEVRPVYYRHLVEGDDIKVDLRQMVRTAPLVYPTYADVRFSYSAYFVPYRLIFKYVRDFLDDNKVQWSDGSMSIPKVPVFSTRALTNMFVIPSDNIGNNLFYAVQHGQGVVYNPITYNKFKLLQPAVKATDNQVYSHAIAVDSASTSQAKIALLVKDPSSVVYDVKIPVAAIRVSNTDYIIYEYFNFTQKGKLFLKVLYSLGYKFEWLSSEFIESAESEQINLGAWKDVIFNAFGLLSFFLVFNEFFTLSQYRPSRKIMSVLQALSEGLTQGSDYNVINSSTLLTLFLECEPVFESNYFTSAWQQPNAVVEGAEPIQNTTINALNLGSLSSEFNDYQQRVNSTGNPSASLYDVESSSSGGPVASQAYDLPFIQQFAKRLQDFIRRRLLSGSSPHANIYSEMGVNVPNKDIDFVQYLGTKEVPLQIMDVTNVAASESNKLGEYGGRAIAPAEQPIEFKYSAEERGLFMILSELRPQLELVQGFDRHNVDRSLYDFYRPAFEDVGLQPILQGEICSLPEIGWTSTSGRGSFGDIRNLTINQLLARGITPNQIFGFTQRYGHYKSPQSWISGDFSIGKLNGINEQYSAYHLATLRGVYDDDNVSMVAQGDLNYIHAKQYDRIFNVDSDVSDHFFAILHFTVTMHRKMLSVSDSWNVNGKGNDVTLDLNGN